METKPRNADRYIIATPDGAALGSLCAASAALAYRTMPAALVMYIERDGERYNVSGFTRDGKPIIENNRRNAS